MKIIGTPDETKKEPKQVPVKIDKELAKKSIISFHQSLKKMQSHL